MNSTQKIKKLISSKNFLIYVITNEEERLEYTLNSISKQIFSRDICTWDFIEGYTKNPNFKNLAKKNPLQALENIKDHDAKIFFLKDFSSFTNDLGIIRKIKNLSKTLKLRNQYIFINQKETKIPNELKDYITLTKFDLPNEKEIEKELKRIFNKLKINDNQLKNYLVDLYKGFTINKMRRSICQIAVNKKSTIKILSHINSEKQEIIQQGNVLELCNSNCKIEEIAGLNNLKHWLKIRNKAFSKQAYYYGINIPKGILLVGIQGTGKSLSAKAISSEWRLPLLRLDISKIFSGILGESESKIIKIINTCEQVSPCILWIDEIDKIFAKNQQIYDGGTTNRVNSIVLNWLSERKNKIFIVATANNISNLPNEMIRKGRFDEIFFVNLPRFEDRLHTFKIHLKKVRPLSWYKYNLFYLSQISKHFSGAEIEQFINEAMFSAFYKNREFTTKDIINSIKAAIPLYSTNELYNLKLQKLLKSGKIREA